MITFVKGNLMDSGAKALVNTVNTAGVMGKGIALQFKQLFPRNYKAYREACLSGQLKTGSLFTCTDSNTVTGERLIINFPTKAHWRNPSEYIYIENGLSALRELIITFPIQSIAIPPLGCGNGGLDWQKVRPMIFKALHDLPAEILVYEPFL